MQRNRHLWPIARRRVWEKQSTETLWIGPDVEVGKDFKEAVTNVFKEANYVQKLNKNMMTVIQ